MAAATASLNSSSALSPREAGWLTCQQAQAGHLPGPCTAGAAQRTSKLHDSYARALQHCVACGSNYQHLVHEFQLVLGADQSIGHSSEDAQDLNAAGRNRYYNVLPYDHNRCKLGGAPGGSDYINASLIGLRPPGPQLQYIAAQGPLTDTALHFWQMALEQGSPAVVMLTNTLEKGYVKCAQYWPRRLGEVLQLPGLTVTATAVHEFGSECTARVLRLDRTAGGGTVTASRHLTHFHYHAWPDHGTPGSTASIRALSAALGSCAERSASGPVIVHCSAGIGRTGTFCALDILRHRFATWAEAGRQLSDAELAAALDVPLLVHELRRQRAGMVQTLEQYQFIYQAAAEELMALAAGSHAVEGTADAA